MATNICTAYGAPDKSGNKYDLRRCAGPNCPLGRLGGKENMPACPKLKGLIEARRLAEQEVIV